MNVQDFCQWLAEAKPGQRVVYHTGILARDRYSLTRDGKVLGEKEAIGSIAHAAMLAAERGDVHLVQQRVGAGFDYIAEKRSPKAARNTRIVQARDAGKRQMDIAQEFGMSVGRVKEILAEARA